MNYNHNNGNRYIVTIKNKWTNSSRAVALTDRDGNAQQLHKYAYYNHTSNLEDIVCITDHRKRTVFTLRGGFRKP